MTAAPCDVERATIDYLRSCSEPRVFAMGASRQIDQATQLLLRALNTAVDDAARVGSTDTGARRVADALLDARIAVLQAVTAAGRALAERERIVDLPASGAPTAA